MNYIFHETVFYNNIFPSRIPLQRLDKQKYVYIYFYLHQLISDGSIIIGEIAFVGNSFETDSITIRQYDRYYCGKCIDGKQLKIYETSNV